MVARCGGVRGLYAKNLFSSSWPLATSALCRSNRKRRANSSLRIKSMSGGPTSLSIFEPRETFADMRCSPICSSFSAIDRSEEHTSELQSLMRISYAVFCLKKKNIYNTHTIQTTTQHINKHITLLTLQ